MKHGEYVAQTKTPLDVIFHYRGKDKIVESLYFTNKELKEMSK